MKISEHKKKMYKRIISMMLVFVLVLGYYPAEFIQEKVKEDTGIIRTVHAATDPNVLAGYIATYGASNSWSFTSGDGRLAQYSKCFEDADFAQNHKGDTIILATTGTGAFVFDSDYEPIGTEDYPFEGKLIFTTSAGSFSISAYTPVFNYVSDAVSFRDTNGTNIPIVINRVGDVGDEISPLFAMHVKGSGLSGPASWLITLDSSSAHSYSGVIYEMYNAAKINLTFTDNSSHTPILDPNGNIISGSIIDNEESRKHYGILCGRLAGSSELTATYTCTDTTNAVTFIGTETAYCGGLIGEINNSTFELLSGSSTAKVDFQSAKDQVGFVCGHSEGGTITLPTAYDFEGTVDGKDYAGGMAGYCKNTVVNYVSTTDKITLSNCNVKNGTTTGGVFGYYECDTYANDILIDRSYELKNCKVEGTKLNGGVVGEYKPNYSHAVTIDLDKFTLGSTIELKTGKTAGGLFGKYTAPGNVTITDSKTDNTHFAPPTSSVAYGGIIGEYVNQNYANTLTLSGFTVNNLNATSDGNVGGVIRQLTGSTYVNVSGVSVTNASVSSATLFGGIVSTLDSGNTGSFIDVADNFTLTLSSGTYKGGAIAGSFKKGIVRFAGTTDISGAQAANGYAQLIYENDETLVYAKGSGSDSNWTLKRNASTTASDLGQWGEVVRLFKVGDVYKNAEDAGIVSVANNKVTVASVTADPAINDEVSFAKVALNMQLNDGSDHGALCFASGGANKTSLLSSIITVNGEIDLSGTGLLGFMRDGGNGKYLDTSNTFKNIEFFTGSIVGSNNAEIKMATGELYGTYEGTSSGTGGKIYLANNYGHDSQGLFAFAKAASITDIKISGTIDVERNAGSDYLYVGALFGAITNGADLSEVDITTTISTTRTGDIRFYIGGVAGVYDGKETPETGSYDLTIEDSSTIKPTINLYGAIGCESGFDKKSTYVGGVLGLLKGLSSTKYGVAISSSGVSPSIIIDDAVVDTDLSYLGGMIGRVAKNTTNARTISLNSVTMTNARVDTKAKHAGGLLGAMWETTDVTIDGLAISGSNVYHKYSNTGSNKSGLVFMGTGKWDIKSLSISNTTFSSTDTASTSFGLIVNQAYSGDDGLYINLKNSGYTLSGVTVPTASKDANYYVDEIAADTCSGDILAGGNGTGIVNINMNTASGTLTKIVDEDTPATGTGTYQNRLHSQLGNLISNQNSRYYYNLDAMLAKGTKGSAAPGGEQFLLWSVYKYAAPNINGYFKSDDNMITGTAIDLSGLSYYPIAGGSVTLPDNASVTFGFKDIHDLEAAVTQPDNWSRYPDDTGAPKSDNARNQHYLMQTGLFTTVTSLTADTLTLTGDFGYVEGVASGALINGSTSGSVSLTGLTLNKLTPSNSNSYLLMNYINGTGDALPSLTV
ncbi:MAG: hypothetical protein J6O53_01530, partial [Eubacterium sp.]|nr:hypothetical protein [Eubacterium sp.]